MTKIITGMVAVALIAVFGMMLVAPALTQAADPPTPREGLKEIETSSGLQKGTPAAFVSNIIKWILGVVGVILVAMFVYGGVMYATSAGNDERVETGKKIMIYAIIGVAIIAAAFIASDYVIKALIPDTTSSGI